MSKDQNTSDGSWPMTRNDRREDGSRGRAGTMTRPGTRPRTDQVPETGTVTPAPRRDQQGRPVPPERPATSRQAFSAQSPDSSARNGGPRAKRVPPGRVAAQRPAREQGLASRLRAGGKRPAGQGVATPAPAGTRPEAGAPWRVPLPGRAARPRPAVPLGPPDQPAQTTEQQSRPLHQTQAGGTAPHRMPFMLLLCGLLGGALVSALVISTTLAEGTFQITKLQDSTSALTRQRQALEDQVAQAQSAQVIEQRALQLGMRPAGELWFVNLKTGKTSSDAATGSERNINVPGYTP